MSYLGFLTRPWRTLNSNYHANEYTEISHEPWTTFLGSDQFVYFAKEKKNGRGEQNLEFPLEMLVDGCYNE